MTKLTILGPNLRDQSKGSFHVHAAGCADLGRHRGEESYTAEFDSIDEVVDLFYEDIMAEELENHGEVNRSWYDNDFHVLPCVKFPKEAK